MKVLVIGDIHGETVWKKFGDIEQLINIPNLHTDFDLYIFLGDYFDSFHITSEKILANFYEIIQFKNNYPDKVVLLMGNHELHYLLSPIHLSNPYLCSGYNGETHLQLIDFYKKNHSLFKAAYQHNNYLFTHAGVSNKWIKEVYRMSDAIEVEGYTNYADLINTDFLYRNSSVFAVGHLRGGYAKAGGPFWADKRETEVDWLDDIHQVCGHTATEEIIFVGDEHSSITYCDVLQSKNPIPLILNI